MSFPEIFGVFSDYTPLPLWKQLCDYALALVMWALVARFVIVVLVGDTPPLRALRLILRLTDRLMRLSSRLTPRALTPAAHSLYAAFIVFLLRYYGLPLINAYTVSGLASLPAEARIAEAVSFLLGLI